jgi:hypothetical protein
MTVSCSVFEFSSEGENDRTTHIVENRQHAAVPECIIVLESAIGGRPGDIRAVVQHRVECPGGELIAKCANAEFAPI